MSHDCDESKSHFALTQVRKWSCLPTASSCIKLPSWAAKSDGIASAPEEELGGCLSNFLATPFFPEREGNGLKAVDLLLDAFFWVEELASAAFLSSFPVSSFGGVDSLLLDSGLPL